MSLRLQSHCDHISLIIGIILCFVQTISMFKKWYDVAYMCSRLYLPVAEWKLFCSCVVFCGGTHRQNQLGRGWRSHWSSLRKHFNNIKNTIRYIVICLNNCIAYDFNLKNRNMVDIGLHLILIKKISSRPNRQ